MLSDTLENISDYLKKNVELSEEKIEEFVDLFKIYKVNQYVYPEYFINESSLNEKECYKIFSNLVYIKILKKVYKVICPHCQYLNNEVLENFDEVEEYIFCESCGDKVYYEDKPLKYVVLFYKVVSEEWKI